ncbi:PRC-barrel domain-containing protein [Streptomyces sp. ISL-90]|nr:PRC-barrel domain-containing protein [Streptomyces sp. ISL-90]
MPAQSNPGLIKLSDSELSVATEEEEVRGRSVKDMAGQDLGRIEDLLIDPDERRVRFLVVGSGGFLGLGEQQSFIPVDAVSRVDEDVVTVDLTRENVAGAPAYDPDLVAEPSYLEDIYGYYGFVPFWGPGYIGPPGFPREPNRPPPESET